MVSANRSLLVLLHFMIWHLALEEIYFKYNSNEAHKKSQLKNSYTTI